MAAPPPRPGGRESPLTPHFHSSSNSALVRGDRLVVYGAGGGALTLYGLDVKTGSVVWRQAATPSGSTPGVALSVTAVGSNVVYLRPDPGGGGAGLSARLVGADVET